MVSKNHFCLPLVVSTPYEESVSPHSELRISLCSNTLCISQYLCAATKHNYPLEQGPHLERYLDTKLLPIWCLNVLKKYLPLNTRAQLLSYTG